MKEDHKDKDVKDSGQQVQGNAGDAGESKSGFEPYQNADNGGLGYYDPALFGEYNGVRAPNAEGPRGNAGVSGSTASGDTGGTGFNGGGTGYSGIENTSSRPSGGLTPVKKKNGLKLFLVIAAIFVVLILLYAILGPARNGYDRNNKYEPAGGNHIAVVNITGTISLSSDSSYAASSYNQNWLLNTIDGLMKNSSNRGIVLYFNTPGGSVYATDEVYLKLEEYKEETGRPIYAAFGPTSASGGYYMAMASDKIFANRNTMTGSIGVTMGTFYDVSELLNKLGVKTYTMTSGDNKAMGSSVEPMTEQQQRIIESILDESYNQFLDVVAKGRKMDKQTLKPIADGRVYTAQQALKLGLVDEIGTEDDAIQAMKEDFGLSSANVVKYSYTPKTPIWADILGQISKSKLGNREESDLSAVLKLMEENDMEPMYLMP